MANAVWIEKINSPPGKNPKISHTLCMTSFPLPIDWTNEVNPSQNSKKTPQCDGVKRKELGKELSRRNTWLTLWYEWETNFCYVKTLRFEVSVLTSLNNSLWSLYYILSWVIVQRYTQVLARNVGLCPSTKRDSKFCLYKVAYLPLWIFSDNVSLPGVLKGCHSSLKIT